MQTALLVSALIAVTTAAAAEIKDPAVVSAEWQKSAEQMLAAPGPALTLREQCPVPERPKSTPASPAKPRPVFEKPVPFEGLVRPPKFDAKAIPHGAKPYQYRGETYWLVPIAQDAGF